MARLPRIVVPGQALHIVQRGNNRKPIFFTDADYRYYLECLSDAARRFGCAIHAYVLMTNHVHLLLTPDDVSSPSLCLQSLGRKYVRYVNDLYQRSGTLWEGRYKSALIDSEHYLLACYRYIELNPVRANMVARPSDYAWSSFRCNALGEQNGVISPHDQYLQLGMDKVKRLHGYQSLFVDALTPELLRQFRIYTEKGSVIGHEGFRDEIANMLNRKVVKHGHGGDRRSESFLSFSRGLSRGQST